MIFDNTMVKTKQSSLPLLLLLLQLWPIIGSAQVGDSGAMPGLRIQTLFSVECRSYFDWQTVGIVRSHRASSQPGPLTRLLSCTQADLQSYRGFDLAPTHVVPSRSRNPTTGDWYPAINKPAGVVHWLENSPDAKNVDWVVILDADMIIRHPITPWELGAEKGRPVSAEYGYLIGCDNILATLHTKHPENCDKVGGMLVIHIDDLRKVAPLWLSKTQEVRDDKAHWGANFTGDIYGLGWISEMYGYSFAAAEVGLQHKIAPYLMIYPGYIPREGVEPLLVHYGLTFTVGNWSFGKADHYDDDIVYNCNRLFPAPPYPKQVLAMESDADKRRALFLSIECINTINEGLVIHHASHGCPKPPRSNYHNYLKSWRMIMKKVLNSTFTSPERAVSVSDVNSSEVEQSPVHEGKNFSYHSRIHTIFSTECSTYFDWQTVGLVHSFELSGQPGNMTRLLSCTQEQLKTYKGLDLAPTHLVPSYSWHPLTGDWYPAINKPAAIMHWLNHVQTDAEFVVILDADMILRGTILPEEFGAEKGHPVSVAYDYLVGCDNILAQMHTRFPEYCDKVGGVIIMHIEDLRSLAPLWLHKTEEVRGDRAHWIEKFTGDMYEQGWISEMYGYSFGAAEIRLRHKIRRDIMLYPGYIPPEGVEPRVLHYGLEFGVGDWKFDKADWRDKDVTDTCWRFFPEPPHASTLKSIGGERKRDLLNIECIKTLNHALYLHHKRRGCRELDFTKDVLEDHIVDIEDSSEISSKGRGSRGQVDDKISGTDGEKEGDELSDMEDFGKVLLKDSGDENRVHIDTEEDIENMEHILRTTLNGKPFVSPQRGILGSVIPGRFVGFRYWVVAASSLLVFGFLVIVSSVRQSQKEKQARGRTKRQYGN